MCSDWLRMTSLRRDVGAEARAQGQTDANPFRAGDDLCGGACRAEARPTWDGGRFR
jgi:hypothetical protein